MHVRRTKREAVVNQRRIDHHTQFSAVEQVAKVTQVSIATADTVAGAVLVQDEDLAGAEPTL